MKWLNRFLMSRSIRKYTQIAKRCNVNIELNKTYLPKFPTENGQPAEEYLEELLKKGLRNVYSPHLRNILNVCHMNYPLLSE